MALPLGSLPWSKLWEQEVVLGISGRASSPSCAQSPVGTGVVPREMSFSICGTAYCHGSCPSYAVLGTGVCVVSPELAQETPLPQISRVGLQMRWHT